jgi:hypothetical protein
MAGLLEDSMAFSPAGDKYVAVSFKDVIPYGDWRVVLAAWLVAGKSLHDSQPRTIVGGLVDVASVDWRQTALRIRKE